MSLRLILVIDDQHQSRQATRENLQEKGYEVVCAVDGEHALRKIRQQPFALVMMSASLAGTSGLEVMRRLRSVAPNVPVIIVAEHPSPESARAFLNLGAYAYLSRPVLADTLSTVVENAVESTLQLAASKNDARAGGDR